MKRYVCAFSVLACFTLLLSHETQTSLAQTIVSPQLPRVFLDTTYVPPTGATIRVQAGGSLQTAINSARMGDVILLQAGATFTGNFTLPNKTGSGWVTIRTSAADSALPPPGTRVTPADAGLMPKIITPNSSDALKTSSGAHHYRFIGIEFGIAPGVTSNSGLIQLGSSSQTSLSVVPHDIIFDRCYIHGNRTRAARRGVALNSARTSIIDSYIADFHGVGYDTQAICGWNGPGPFKIVNNYLEGAGENIMFGGGNPLIPGLVPSDIEFRKNHCFKPLYWKVGHPSYAGIHWTVKNHLELKNARRVLIDGNLFENCWKDGQVGYSQNWKSDNTGGAAIWSVVEDVTFTNNIIRHVGAGINIVGRDWNDPSEQVKRILIRNNLLFDVNSSIWGGDGNFLKITETANVTVNHNTVIQNSRIITAYGVANTGFTYINNLTMHNKYGVKGDSYATGTATLNAYFPGYVFRRNVLVGGSSSRYPTDNFFPATITDVGFLDLAGGNYRLSSASPYRNRGTDSRDIGADINAIQAALTAP
jgi:hypothetical protein